MTLRALIIDDEFLARRKVEQLLAHFPNIKIIGEARNGEEAVALVRYKSPDLIFLDVEMPDFGGFEVIQKLGPEVPVPYIIFTTAYEHYAVQAFEVDAIDYLLKPLEMGRFTTALEKAHQQLRFKKTDETQHQILKILHQLKAEPWDSYRQFFELKEKGRLVRIPVEEILCLTAQGNYIELITPEKKYAYRSTMQALEGELNPREFIRIHRSYMLQIRYIDSCRYLNNGEYKFLLKNGSEFISGRRYAEQIHQYLDNANP